MPRPNEVTALSVDLSKVEDRREGGGSAAHVVEGDYLLELKQASVRKNANDDGRHVLWVWKIIDGPEKSTGSVYDRTSLKEDALWKLRNVLQDLLGKQIPKKALNIDLAKYAGKRIGATLEDDEPYKGKIKSRIAYTFPASEFESKKAAADDSDEEEDEDQAADLSDDSSEDEEELETVDEDDI